MKKIAMVLMATWCFVAMAGETKKVSIKFDRLNTLYFNYVISNNSVTLKDVVYSDFDNHDYTILPTADSSYKVTPNTPANLYFDTNSNYALQELTVEYVREDDQQVVLNLTPHIGEITLNK